MRALFATQKGETQGEEPLITQHAECMRVEYMSLLIDLRALTCPSLGSANRCLYCRNLGGKGRDKRPEEVGTNITFPVSSYRIVVSEVGVLGRPGITAFRRSLKAEKAGIIREAERALLPLCERPARRGHAAKCLRIPHYAAPNEPNAGRYSLRRKILLGFFSALALLVVVWAWSIFALWQLGNAGEQVLEENFRSILAAESMIDVLERQNSAALLVLLGEEEAASGQFHNAEVEFLQWLGAPRTTLPSRARQRRCRLWMRSTPSFCALLRICVRQ